MDSLKHHPYLSAAMADSDLDATGLLCPLPVLKARKRLAPLARGQTLAVTTDDPAAIIDIPHFCSEAGHDLLTSETEGDVARWVIRKG